MAKTVTIMGTKYRIEYKTAAQDSILDTDADAYCDWTERRIVLRDPKDTSGNLGNMDVYWKNTLRHEIVHAFLYECGLAENANGTDAWPKNEEMVDWIAFTGPKIYAAWAEAGAL